VPTPSTPPEVRVVPVADEAAGAVIGRLFPLYLHDLSAFTDYYRVGADGRWAPDHLPTWLASPEATALLVLADDGPAGFVLVAHAGFPYVPAGPDHTMGEFFVLAGWRRRGVGRHAADLVFDAFPGTWRVEQLRRNIAATAFWRGVIGVRTGGRYEESAPFGHPVQRFSVP